MIFFINILFFFMFTYISKHTDDIFSEMLRTQVSIFTLPEILIGFLCAQSNSSLNVLLSNIFKLNIVLNTYCTFLYAMY